MKDSIRQHRFILSANSDIGVAMALQWIRAGHRVSGTYRSENENAVTLQKHGVSLTRCDVLEESEIDLAIESTKDKWDVLILAPGTLEPIGKFDEVDFDEWEKSIRVNLLGPLRFLQKALPTANFDSRGDPCVISFAGGGVNGPTVRYSSYTLAKVAMVKAMELFDAEFPNIRWISLGTGWVDTKIHRQTLAAEHLAGDNYDKTLENLQSGNTVPMEKVVRFTDWLIEQPAARVSGRNFSVSADPIDDENWVSSMLESNPHHHKLRRYGYEMNS